MTRENPARELARSALLIAGTLLWGVVEFVALQLSLLRNTPGGKR
jgi:hypothetical protein